MNLFTLKIENANGQIFDLTSETNRYIVTDISGLTRPDMTVNTSESIADGSFFNSIRMPMRNIVINIRLRGEIETNRQQLYEIFPEKTPCTLYFQNQNRNVKISGFTEKLSGSIFSEKEEIQVSILCPKPYFEDLETVQQTLSRVAKLFEFPFSIEVNEPILISEIQELPSCTILNGGNVKCGCILDISVLGDVKGLRIYNVTTQEMFGFNFDFQAGDSIHINTTTGNKECFLWRESVKINLLFYRLHGSKWFELASGTNIFTLRVNEGLENVKISFSVVELYGGV